MIPRPEELLTFQSCPRLNDATLVLAFSGWMDGGDVSTGTVRRLVDLLEARQVGEIDSDPFYLLNFPGTMEIAALFRPTLKIEDGLVSSLQMPTSLFYCHEPARLFLFLGREPNLGWRTFADCILEFARHAGVRRSLFVGSFGGAVPHTREPRLHVACSSESLREEMDRYGLRRTAYEGPGSFASYLLSRATEADLEMTSLAAEIPGYLQGRNPVCIEAVTRRLAQILRLPLELAALRAESTEWEAAVSQAVEEDQEMARTIRQLEQAYDEELLKLAQEDEP